MEMLGVGAVFDLLIGDERVGQRWEVRAVVDDEYFVCRRVTKSSSARRYEIHHAYFLDLMDKDGRLRVLKRSKSDQ